MNSASQRCIKALVEVLNNGIASLETRGIWYAQILRGERDAALSLLAPSEPAFHDAILASMAHADLRSVGQTEQDAFRDAVTKTAPPISTGRT